MTLWPQDIVNHVYDPLRAPVKNQNIYAQRYPAISIWQARQAAVQVLGKGLQSFLQSRRQRAIALQMFLQAGRKVAVALGQPRRQVGILAVIIPMDDVAVMDAENHSDSASAVAIAATVIVIILVALFVVPLAVALAVALCQALVRQDR